MERREEFLQRLAAAHNEDASPGASNGRVRSLADTLVSLKEAFSPRIPMTVLGGLLLYSSVICRMDSFWESLFNAEHRERFLMDDYVGCGLKNSKANIL